MPTEMPAAFTTAIGAVKGDIITLVLIALPVVLAIVGLGLAINYGIKFLRKGAH
jgi:hypothetical protein